ncbi:MAG: hypothetical protein ABIO70_17265 [Pseudomonadota bacterium]
MKRLLSMCHFLVIVLAACRGGASIEQERAPAVFPAPEAPPPGAYTPETARAQHAIPTHLRNAGEFYGAADSPGFQPDPGYYAEASWDDVRLRCAGHLAAAGRDLARSRVAAGDLDGCAAAYEDLRTRLEGIEIAAGAGVAIHRSLTEAAARDAEACRALARGEDPPDPGHGMASARARYAAFARASAAGQRPDPGPVERTIAPLTVRPEGLEIDRFQVRIDDYQDRHALRVRLVAAYADDVDPWGFTDPWGYRLPEERPRQARALAEAVHAVVSGEARGLTLAELLVLPAAKLAAEEPSLSADDLLTMPTGDSLVDIAGFPGPRSSGALAALDPNDPATQAWFTERAARMMSAPSDSLPAVLEVVVRETESLGLGDSRYYLAKQIRNAGIRSLARRGEWQAARQVTAALRGPFGMDRKVPDMDGLLLVIEGRLAVLAGDPDADEVLRAAITSNEAFLAEVDAAEARGAGGPQALPPVRAGLESGPPAAPAPPAPQPRR